ncbi:serine hydrolase domain-containing protein [Nonomuraea endophytica]|uniref:serine hydrolase domain-containing protein n=1 Tax=Nonomuraea endophytica TaxID=714136 RepID=UPI0037C88854
MSDSGIAASGLRKAYKDKIAHDGGRTRRGRVFSRVAVTALAAALLAGVATTGTAVADGRDLPKVAAGQDRPELQKAMQALVDAGFLGVQMRVNDQDGEWVGSAGVRKLGSAEKPPTNGSFWAGSVVKPFTATMVLQLVAEKKIGLDASVADYLPKLGLDRRITVRMILQHTSGLFNYTGEYFPDGTVKPGIPATGKEWVENRFKSYKPEELVRLALSKEPRFEPGKDWSYANTNYTVAQLLIEKVTGHSFMTEMKRRILRPLKMSHTMVGGDRTRLPGPHARGYYRYQDTDGQWKVADVTRQNVSLLAAAGDLISTTEDLHTFSSALLGGRLLPPKLMAEMRKPHPKSAGIFGSYGLGLYVKDAGPNCGGPVYNHNGSPPGGYSALMISSSDGKRTLIASINWGDAAFDAAQVPVVLDNLVKVAFCGGQSAN